MCSKTASLYSKKAKASLLGAVLFQACNYQKPRDMLRAKKILAILMQPQFQYVLKAYVDVFVKQGKGEVAKNFHELLKACDFKLSDLE